MVIIENGVIVLLLMLAVYYMLTALQFYALLSIKKSTILLTDHPFVSVCIAARNEEDNIERCLLAFLQQDYPLDKIQLLVGDDDSSDETARVVLKFQSEYPELQLSLISIKHTLEGLKGKTNVLAQLFQRAKGEWYFITDADISVSNTWITGMLTVAKEESAEAVSGSTFVESNTVFGRFQGLEWMEAFGLLHTADYYKIPVTAVGNNMVVKKSAYDAVGGYENIPFSVTEDLALYLALQKKGLKHKQVLNSQVIAWTQPITSFMTFLKQRKRWLKGVEKTPFISKLYMMIHALVGAFSLGVYIYNAYWGLYLILLSLAVHVLRIGIISMKTNIKFRAHWLFYILLIDWYQLFCSICILIYYLLPVKVEWKKRLY